MNTELGEKFISCMKMGGKTINISGCCSGDFIVEEAEVAATLYLTKLLNFRWMATWPPR